MLASLITLTLAIAAVVLTDIIQKRNAEPGSQAAQGYSPIPVLSATPTPEPTAPGDTTPQAPPPAPTLEPILLPTPESDPVLMPPTPPPVLLSTPAPGDLGPPDYSFYWFSDTQHYSEKYPETFHAMTEWMRDNAALYNVKYAFFTGDFVDSNTDSQWTVADAAMKKLEEVVPVFAIAGNHDVGTSAVNYANFKKFFGPDRYAENTHIQAWFDGGRGRCDTIEIEGTKYLFAGLGWGGGSSGISWLNTQLAKYPDHKAILFFHDYMNSEGLLSSDGEKLYEKVVKTNKNVFMVLCGHRYNCTLMTTDIHDNGARESYRRVYNILMNYQAFGQEGGDGYLTLIRVYRRQGLMAFDTYSPVKNSWYFFDPVQNINREHFVLPVNF